MNRKVKPTEDDFINALKRLELPSTTNQVAKEAKCGWHTTEKYLQLLVEARKVKYKDSTSEAGRRVTVWWLP